MKEIGVPQGTLVIPKTKFSMLCQELETFLLPTTAKDIVLFGIESHVCVRQTALELLDLGHRVWVLADGVTSRHEEEVAIALADMRHSGARVTSSEALLFELLRDSRDPSFRAISALVKQSATWRD